jgi:hypothetical protein
LKGQKVHFPQIKGFIFIWSESILKIGLKRVIQHAGLSENRLPHTRYASYSFSIWWPRSEGIPHTPFSPHRCVFQDVIEDVENFWG